MFNFDQAKNLYLSDLRTNDMSPRTIQVYGNTLDAYSAHCVSVSMPMESPAAVASYKAELSNKGNKLVTIAMYLNILHLFFDFCSRCRLLQGENPVLPELMPPRKKIRAERKPYEHLMQEEDMAILFSGKMPKGAHENTFLRNRAMILMLLGCGLRNSELRSLTVSDLRFGDGDEAQVTVRSGKGGKYRIVPFPSVAQQAVKAYLKSGQRPRDLPDSALLFGVGNTSQEWHEMNRDNLSTMCQRYIKSASGFENARSHACRHAFASLNLSSGVPMAEIQTMLGHSSITTTEHYAALLRPTAPTASGNKVFNDKFQSLALD